MVFGELNGRVGGPIFVALGLALLVFGFRSGLEARSFLATAIRTQGIVIALNAGGGHPQIQFTTTTNEAVSYPQGGLVFGLHAGDKIQVLFSAENPAQTATVYAVGAVWFTTLLLGGLGIVSLIAGTLAWFLSVSK